MTSPLNAQELHQQAETYLSQNQIQDTIALCSQIIEADSKFIPAYQTLGKALYLAKRFDEAEKCYRRVIHLNGNDAVTYNNLASIYARQKQWQKALSCYQQALQLQPKESKTYRNLGRLWTQLGDENRAGDSWFRAYSLTRNQVSVEEHIQLGDRLLKNNQIEKAIACYRRSLEPNPDYEEGLEKLRKALQHAQEELAPSQSHFMIFALARTGSSTLLKLLNAHPEINLKVEPFHQDLGIPFQERYIHGFEKDLTLGFDPTRSGKSQHWIAPYPLPILDHIVAEIHQNHNGIKHLDYSISFDQNLHLLVNAYDKVIFLNRKNQLKRIVSLYISLQAGYFQGSRDQLFQKTYHPLDPEQLKGHMDWEEKRFERYRTILQKLGRNVFELYYEDLFDSKLTLTAKMEKLNEIYRYLGLNQITELDAKNKIETLLDPNTNKFNNESSYRLIPNIDEIAEKLGSDETGYLFE
ncbi:MAG: tetratricopeptide repeat protein [Halothece sp. Uz-M2-17]|nr:tetratricopeptide repeat protein [Halothece sp. Uz-M2-17]